jgi:hypothetical protein
MPERTWNDVRADILDKLDIEAEAQSFGVEFSGDMRDSGWRPCFAMGREDRKPSAALHVGEGPMRGFYIDSANRGDGCWWWSFAARFGPFNDWREAVSHYGKQTKVRLKHTPESTNEDRIRFKEMTEARYRLMLRPFLEAYPPITADAVVRNSLPGFNHGTYQMGFYPKDAPEPQLCVVLPLYGPRGIEFGPTGYTLLPASGQRIPLYRGKDSPPEMVKRINVGNGMLGRYGIEKLEFAKRVLKVEGITDLLTAESIVPLKEDQDPNEFMVVLTNASGASEVEVPRRFAHKLAGKDVCVCHDADEPGQDGAAFWVEILLGADVGAVRNAELPYPLEEKAGKDLREWIA